MKKFLSLSLLLCLVTAQVAVAQLTTCNVTGTIYDANGLPFVGATITVHRVQKQGKLIRVYPPSKYQTVAGGVFSIPLPRDSTAWIEAMGMPGFSVAGGVPVKIRPDCVTAELVTLESNVKFPAEIPVVVPGGEGGGPAAWGNITGTISAQTDLQSALDSKATSGHTHSIANVTGLQTALDSKAASNHNHAGVYELANANIQSHISSTANPHSVTKTQVGLGNVTNDAQLKTSSNLSDLSSVTTARTNLGLGDSATKNVGTGAGEVAAGNHNHSGVYEPANANIQAHIASTSNPHSVTKSQVGLGNVSDDAQLKIASNLSDLNNVTTARSNLGLGALAVKSTIATGDIDNGAVSLVKITNITSDRLIGRDTASSGVPEEIALAGSLEFSGSQTIRLVGDSASPGNSKYYGTNGIGTKGFFDLPSGGGGSAKSVLGAAVLPAVAASSTLYTAPFTQSVTVTADDYRFYLPCGGTLKNLRLWLGSFAASNVIVTVRINGVATALTASGSGPIHTLMSDTTHTVSVAAGDLLTISVQNTDTSAVAIGGWSLEFDPS